MFTNIFLSELSVQRDFGGARLLSGRKCYDCGSISKPFLEFAKISHDTLFPRIGSSFRTILSTSQNREIIPFPFPIRWLPFSLLGCTVASVKFITTHTRTTAPQYARRTTSSQCPRETNSFMSSALIISGICHFPCGETSNSTARKTNRRM